jgi:hypothetical protein
MSFGPALSLGVPSFDEVVDIKTIEPLKGDGFLERVNESSPDGLRFVAWEPLEDGAAALGTALRESHWLIVFARRLVDDLGGREWLEGRIRSVLAVPEMTVHRKGKRGTRVVDVRGSLLDLRMGGPDADSRLERAGMVGSWYTIQAILRLAPPTIRIPELASALVENVYFRAIRVGLMVSRA